MGMRLIGLLALIGLIACGEGDAPAGGGRVPRMGVLYKATAEEGDSFVTVVAQFYNNEDGAANIALPSASSVALDGAALPQDSAGMQGVFYETQLPVAAFAGAHQFKLQYEGGRVFTDSFAFYPFTLAFLPSVVSVQDVVLKLNGLPDGSPVRIVLTDTAFDSNGINEMDTVQNGNVVLPVKWLQTLAPGPVTMHLFAESDKPLQSGLRGDLSVSYGLSRSFEVVR